MNTIRQAVISICFTAIAVGIIEIIMPRDSFRPSMKLLTGAVLLLSMLTPFVGGMDIDFDTDFKLYDYSVNESLEQGVAISLKESVAEIIRKYDVKDAKVEINMDSGADNSIVINKVMLYFNHEDMDKAEKIVMQVREKLDVKAYIGEMK